MAYPGAKIYLLDATGFTEVAYEDTGLYAVTGFPQQSKEDAGHALADDE
jgi:predicted ATPase